jgi:hypothetical protein
VEIPRSLAGTGGVALMILVDGRGSNWSTIFLK